MTADLAQRLRDWAGAVAHRDLEAGLREAADAIDYAVRAADVNDRALDSLTAERDAEIRLSGSRLRHLNEAEARLAAAELHLFSGHGCDCRHMAERRAAYLGATEAYSYERGADPTRELTDAEYLKGGPTPEYGVDQTIRKLRSENLNISNHKEGE